jgi:hypothetical protein
MAKADERDPPARKPRIRIGRILTALTVLALLGAGLYGASWLNARRYFLIVSATEVRVAKGRMLPVGHASFVPLDPAIRRAYETIPLPGGMKVPRGTTTFTDRVELDQAIYRLLEDAAELALTAHPDRAAELVPRYLAQMRSLPGVTVDQQASIARLERDARYVSASAMLNGATQRLTDAEAMFRESANGSRFVDGAAKADAIRAALEVLQRDLAKGRNPPNAASEALEGLDARTATAATTTVAR